jgi:hypothetical protein
VVFVALISLDFGVIQQGQHHVGGNGPEMSSQWARVNLPRGFGPAGMSLPPWNPYAVAQSPEWQQQQQQLLMMQQQQLQQQQPPGVGAGGVVPALNGDPAGAAAGYFPMQPPGMAGSYVPGDATMMRRPEPTKPPPRPQPAPPPPATPASPVAEKAIEKLAALLERLDERELEHKRSETKRFKQVVKQSGDLWKLTSESAKRVDRIAMLEDQLKLLSEDTEQGLRGMRKSNQRSSSGSMASKYGGTGSLFGEASAGSKAAQRKHQHHQQQGHDQGLSSNATYMEDLERRIDKLAEIALLQQQQQQQQQQVAGGGGDSSSMPVVGNGGGGGGGVSSKALRNAKAEVERLKAEAASLRESKAGAESSLERLQEEVHSMRAPGQERAKGAFAVLANTDPFSVKAALAVCHMLNHHNTKYDVLVITPTRMDQNLHEAVRRGGCLPTTLGLAPYPPKFSPMRPSFKVCWHKLRLFLLTQYQAVVALDSDIVVLSNIDDLVDKVLAEPEGDAMFWMAAHDETPLCEECGAEVSGAPNAGVFGLRPSRLVYEKLIERSKKPSPWYGERWAYSEQELLSVFFLVENEVHNSRMVWLENAYNSFACKYACPPPNNQPVHAQPAILHFVGVDKPYTLFVDAPRRSKIVNALTKVDVSHAFVAEHIQTHYQVWFEHYMASMKRAFGGAGGGGKSNHPLPQLLWHDSQVVSANGGNGNSNGQQKRWIAFLHVPKTGGSALISSFMGTLFGNLWFQLDCGLKANTNPATQQQQQQGGSGDAPPLCATYGSWTMPKHRKPAHMGRCTAIGCMGHLPFENMRTALGGELLKVTDFVTVLRSPAKLFISEYYYIRDQLSKPQPSLQFVGDPELLKQMMGGMPLEEYTEYVRTIVKHGRSGLGSAFNRQT